MREQPEPRVGGRDPAGDGAGVALERDRRRGSDPARDTIARREPQVRGADVGEHAGELPQRALAQAPAVGEDAGEARSRLAERQRRRVAVDASRHRDELGAVEQPIALEVRARGLAQPQPRRHRAVEPVVAAAGEGDRVLTRVAPARFRIRAHLEPVRAARGDRDAGRIGAEGIGTGPAVCEGRGGSAQLRRRAFAPGARPFDRAARGDAGAQRPRAGPRPQTVEIVEGPEPVGPRCGDGQAAIFAECESVRVGPAVEVVPFGAADLGASRAQRRRSGDGALSARHPRGQGLARENEDAEERSDGAGSHVRLL